MKWPTMPAAIRQPASTTAMIAAAMPRFFFARSGFGALAGLSRRGISARGFFSFFFFARGGSAGASGGSSGASPANLSASSSSAEKSLS